MEENALTLALTPCVLANNNDDNDRKVRASEAGSEGEAKLGVTRVVGGAKSNFH
jgi:hypothetical protein